MINDIRDVIVNNEPFDEFHIWCGECGEDLFTIDEYVTNRHQINEALLIYRVNEHARLNNHTFVEGTIKPIESLQTIDASITVNS